MNKDQLIKWLECPRTIDEVRTIINSLGEMSAADKASWCLAWIAEQIRSCDDPAAQTWAGWATSENMRLLNHRTLFAFAPDSDPIRSITLELIRMRVIRG